MTMANHFVHDGYLDAGWNLVVMGDCWLANERDERGRLQPDSKRFPSGIPALAKFVSGSSDRLQSEFIVINYRVIPIQYISIFSSFLVSTRFQSDISVLAYISIGA